jgi:hypothetical protein
MNGIPEAIIAGGASKKAGENAQPFMRTKIAGAAAAWLSRQAPCAIVYRNDITAPATEPMLLSMLPTLVPPSPPPPPLLLC